MSASRYETGRDEKEKMKRTDSLSLDVDSLR